MILIIPGYTSQRDPQEGTWFIQSLVEIFMNHSHEKELIDLLRMTSDYLSKFTNAYGDKQTCNVEMRHLYKRIYFNPGVALGGTRSRQRRVSGTQTQMSPKATRRRSFSTPPTSPLTETANNQLWKKKIIFPSNQYSTIVNVLLSMISISLPVFMVIIGFLQVTKKYAVTT